MLLFMSTIPLNTQADKETRAHRSDIQGLRALAVIAVVVFHAGFFLPGGFVGVDIFFVVSGFVITSSLLREHLRTGKINLRSFYSRRFKRLLPALALVVVVTALASNLVLSPLGPQQTAAITGIAAMFSVANVAISLTTGGYFDSAAELNPLLHTWTLSVEEQFYFVFPLAIAVGIFLAKSMGKGAGIVLAAGTSASFILAMFTPVLLTIYATEFLSFYSPITRAWEFGVGALVAWWLLVKPPQMGIGFARVAYLAGLVLIAASFTSISATDHFPGPVTLLPVLGTALTILAGQLAPLGAKDPLRSASAVKIGDWSYSIYLWHWPFIVITSLLWPENPSAAALAALLSVIPAIGSYYLLEQPIRYGHFPTIMKKTLLVGVTIATPVVVTATTWFYAEVVEARFSTSTDLPIGYELGCHGPGLASETLRICEFSNGDGLGAPVPVYLVGDSHAAHFSEGMAEATRSSGQPLSVFTASSCSLLDGVYSQDGIQGAGDDCAAWQEKAFAHLAKSEPGIVVLAATDVYWLDDRTMVSAEGEVAGTTQEKLDLLERGLHGALAKISRADHTIVLVHTVPSWTGDFDWQLDRCTLADTLEGCTQEMPLVVALDQSGEVREVLENQAKALGSTVVDFSDVICPNNLCQTYRNGGWLYRDSNHITNNFSVQLATEWDRIFNMAADTPS